MIGASNLRWDAPSPTAAAAWRQLPPFCCRHPQAELPGVHCSPCAHGTQVWSFQRTVTPAAAERRRRERGRRALKAWTGGMALWRSWTHQSGRCGLIIASFYFPLLLGGACWGGELDVIDPSERQVGGCPGQ